MLRHSLKEVKLKVAATWQDELYLFKQIPRSMLADEREFEQTRHQSHRHLHPAQLTKLFFELYQKWLRAFIRKTQDIDRSEKTFGMLAKDFDSLVRNTHITVFEARQVADHFGIDYDTHLYLCFKVAADWGFKQLNLRSLTNNPTLLEEVMRRYEEKEL